MNLILKLTRFPMELVAPFSRKIRKIITYSPLCLAVDKDVQVLVAVKMKSSMARWKREKERRGERKIEEKGSTEGIEESKGATDIRNGVSMSGNNRSARSFEFSIRGPVTFSQTRHNFLERNGYGAIPEMDNCGRASCCSARPRRGHRINCPGKI